MVYRRWPHSTPPPSDLGLSKDGVEAMDKQDLEAMTKKELFGMCQRLGVYAPIRTKKAELVKLVYEGLRE